MRISIEAIICFFVVYISFEPFLLKFSSDGAYPILKYSPEIVILIFFITVLSAHFLGGGKFIRTPIDMPLLGFSAITFISFVLNNTQMFFWILGLRQIFRYVLLYYTVIYSRLSKDAAKRIIVLLFGVLLVQSAIGIAQAFIGERADAFLLPGAKREFAHIVSPAFVYQFWSPGQRIFATMGRYDRLGTFICFALILALGLFYELGDSKNKKRLMALIVLPAVALVFTYSRMSWLGLIAALFFMNAIIRKDKKFIMIFLSIFLLSSVYLFLYIKSNNLKLAAITDNASMTISSRILSLFSLQELKTSYNGYGRLYFIIQTPKKIISKYPFFGVGLGQYGSGVAYALQNRKIYDDSGLPFGIEGAQGQIDNNWMSIWAESGTLGLIFFTAIIAGLFIFIFDLYKNSADDFTKGLSLGFLGVILAVSTQAFLGPYFEVRTLSFYFWVMGGIVVGMGQQYNEIRN